jgi:hypothetical protein
VHFIDDFSRFTWIFPLKQKSETVHAFNQFKNLVEKQKILGFSDQTWVFPKDTFFINVF